MGILPFFIRLTCTNQRSLSWRSIVNIVGIQHLDSRTLFGVLLIQNISRSSFRSERILKTFNICSWAVFVVHYSLSYKSVLTTQTLYTVTLVLIESRGFFYTRDPRRASVEVSIPIRLSNSLSRENLLLVVNPKYIICSTTSNS